MGLGWVLYSAMASDYGDPGTHSPAIVVPGTHGHVGRSRCTFIYPTPPHPMTPIKIVSPTISYIRNRIIRPTNRLVLIWGLNTLYNYLIATSLGLYRNNVTFIIYVK